MSENDRSRTRKLLHVAFNSKEQVIKINTGNTFAHELAKFLKCWELAKDGTRFITEAVFENNKRADILDLDSCTSIEILQTETKDQYDTKIKSYPTDFCKYYYANELIEVYSDTIKEAMK